MTRTVATLVTLAVIAASSAAFAVAERLKVERAPIGAVRFAPKDRQFSPLCRCPTAAIRLSYVFRRPDTVTVTVVDAKGETVRTLRSAARLARGRHTFAWNGRDDAGRLAQDGAYRIRIRFLDERRSILTPIVFRLDTHPPRVEARISRDVLSPDGDKRGDRLELVYRTSERGTVELAVDGARLFVRRAGAPHVRHVLRWGGRVPAGGTGARSRRVPARPGRHELALTVRDVAGNATTVRFAVTIRFIELRSPAYEARAGGVLRFSVDTDVRSFRFSLRPAGGRARRPVLAGTAQAPAVSVRLPRSVRPGLYVLRVEEDRRHARATVRVLRGAR